MNGNAIVLGGAASRRQPTGVLAGRMCSGRRPSLYNARQFVED